MQCKYFNICANKEMRKLKYIFFFFLFFIFFEGYSQNNYSLGFFDQYGYVFPTNDFIRGEKTGKPISQINSFSLRFSKQTNGSKAWHQLYSYPSYGVGFSYFNFNEPKRMGEAYALYGFYTANLFRLAKFILKNDFAVGTGYFTKHWGIHNLENTAIMTPFNIYIHEGLKMEYMFSKRFRTSLGFAFVHFSNGATKKPNMGVNSFVIQAGLTYNFFEDFSIESQAIPGFNDKLNILSTLYFGLDNVFVTLPNEANLSKKFIYQYYPVVEISEAILYPFNSKHALGLSFNVCYQDNLGSDYYYKDEKLRIRQADFIDRFNLSSAISYEYSIDELSIMLEPGVYILRQLNENAIVNGQLPRFFQNIGLRYSLPNDYFVSVRLRAYSFHVAHYLQLGFGKRIHVKKES